MSSEEASNAKRPPPIDARVRVFKALSNRDRFAIVQFLIESAKAKRRCTAKHLAKAVPSRGRLRQHLTDLRKSKLVESVAGDDGTKTYVVTKPKEAVQLIERAEGLRTALIQGPVAGPPSHAKASDTRSRNAGTANLFGALGNDFRLLIVESPLPGNKAKPKTLSVNEIGVELGGAAAGTISQHLDALKQANLLRMTPRGTTRNYSLAKRDEIKALLKASAALCTKLFGDWQVGRDERGRL
jgi:DNA-binding transcriptional ArsR family regulator